MENEVNTSHTTLELIWKGFLVYQNVKMPRPYVSLASNLSQGFEILVAVLDFVGGWRI